MAHPLGRNGVREMSDRVVLGPNPELVAEARAAWPNRQRARAERGGKWSSIGVEVRPMVPFCDIVTKLAARARDRGEIGEGGGPVWSLAEWQRFIKATREDSFPGLLGTAAFKTVANVEIMIADGKTAREIHSALYWRSRQDDNDREKVAAQERAEAERTAAASFESAVREKMKDERARLEARRRAKEESEDGGQRSRRVAV